MWIAVLNSFSTILDYNIFTNKILRTNFTVRVKVPVYGIFHSKKSRTTYVCNTSYESHYGQIYIYAYKEMNGMSITVQNCEVLARSIWNQMRLQWEPSLHNTDTTAILARHLKCL